MLNLEKKILNHIEKYIYFYFISFISIIGFFIRWLGIEHIGTDMRVHLIPWYERALVSGKIMSISEAIGDYNIPYQFYVALITYFPLPAVFSYKLLSITFDYILALSTAKLAVKLSNKENDKYLYTLVYSAVLLLPTIFLNSGYWGQADSIYCSFIIISLFLLKESKYNFSFIFLGFALAFKLQTIFILPLFLFYYIIQRKYSLIKMMLLIIVSFYTLCIPGFIYGRNLLEPIKIYINQSNYPLLWANYPNFWTIITVDKSNYLSSLLKSTSIFICFSILLVGLFIIIVKKVDIKNSYNFLLITIWTVYTCIMFLVNIHDRYAYLLDILFLISIFLNENMIKYFSVSFIISLITYGNFLFLDMGYLKYGYNIFNILGVINLINYIMFTTYVLVVFLKKDILKYG